MPGDHALVTPEIHAVEPGSKVEEAVHHGRHREVLAQFLVRDRKLFLLKLFEAVAEVPGLDRHADELAQLHQFGRSRGA